ncbi:hypothetical protein MPSEU_000356900 [Mayamaea pseudoterrestris]|nr:hypothetical protein MPSEU_000356900 [Mayamaea pseudoterrestris]
MEGPADAPRRLWTLNLSHFILRQRLKSRARRILNEWEVNKIAFDYDAPINGHISMLEIDARVFVALATVSERVRRKHIARAMAATADSVRNGAPCTKAFIKVQGFEQNVAALESVKLIPNFEAVVSEIRNAFRAYNMTHELINHIEIARIPLLPASMQMVSLALQSFQHMSSLELQFEWGEDRFNDENLQPVREALMGLQALRKAKLVRLPMGAFQTICSALSELPKMFGVCMSLDPQQQQHHHREDDDEQLGRIIISTQADAHALRRLFENRALQDLYLGSVTIDTHIAANIIAPAVIASDARFVCMKNMVLQRTSRGMTLAFTPSPVTSNIFEHRVCMEIAEGTVIQMLAFYENNAEFQLILLNEARRWKIREMKVVTDTWSDSLDQAIAACVNQNRSLHKLTFLSHHTPTGPLSSLNSLLSALGSMESSVVELELDGLARIAFAQSFEQAAHLIAINRQRVFVRSLLRRMPLQNDQAMSSQVLRLLLGRPTLMWISFSSFYETMNGTCKLLSKGMPYDFKAFYLIAFRIWYHA